MRPHFKTIPFTKTRKLCGTNAGEGMVKSGTHACRIIDWCHQFWVKLSICIPGTQDYNSCYIPTEKAWKVNKRIMYRDFEVEIVEPTLHYRNAKVKCGGCTLGNTTQPT